MRIRKKYAMKNKILTLAILATLSSHDQSHASSSDAGPEAPYASRDEVRANLDGFLRGRHSSVMVRDDRDYKSTVLRRVEPEFRKEFFTLVDAIVRLDSFNVSDAYDIPQLHLLMSSAYVMLAERFGPDISREKFRQFTSLVRDYFNSAVARETTTGHKIENLVPVIQDVSDPVEFLDFALHSALPVLLRVEWNGLARLALARQEVVVLQAALPHLKEAVDKYLEDMASKDFKRTPLMPWMEFDRVLRSVLKNPMIAREIAEQRELARREEAYDLRRELLDRARE